MLIITLDMEYMSRELVPHALIGIINVFRVSDPEFGFYLALHNNNQVFQ